MEKSDLKLKLTGIFEIHYDKYKSHNDIKEFNIEATNLNHLIHKLLNVFTKVSLGKIEELLLFISPKRGEIH